MLLRLGVWPDAFGNALGESIADSFGQSTRAQQAQSGITIFDAQTDWGRVPAGMGYDYQGSSNGITNWRANVAAQAAAEHEALYGLNAVNGMDVESDNYNGSRRTATVRQGQGPLSALADLGLNAAQQRAGYGYLLRTGQVQLDRNGVPMVQPGQELHVDLGDTSQSSLAGRAIARESSMRADRVAAAAQAATDSANAAETRKLFNLSVTSSATSYDDMRWIGRRGTPSVNAPLASQDVRGLIDRANNMPWQSDLSREDILSTQRALSRAMLNATENRERLNIVGALRSVAEVAGQRGLLTTGEVLGAPGSLEAGIESQMFGGSNGSVRPSVSAASGYSGQSYRSAFRAYAPEAEALPSGDTVSVFRKMSLTEVDATFETMRLQPPVVGSNSSKYLSESFEKVLDFQNKKALGTQQGVVEFVLDKNGYDTLMRNSVNQVGSRGVDAIKYNFEGIPDRNLRNIGVPPSKLDEFNLLIRDVRKVPGQ